jgi:hypothetical protein
MFSFVFVVCLFGLVLAHGNYPYDTYLKLTRESDLVVEGTVLRVFTSRDAPRARQANGMPGADEILKQHSLVWLKVDRVHKADVEPGETLYLHSWSLYHAPPSCSDATDRGLLTVARSDDRVQAFVKRSASDNSLQLVDLEILVRQSASL